MWRMIWIVSVSLIFSLSGMCQQAMEIDRIEAFLGVASDEDLSAEEVERFVDMMRRPLKINLMSRSRLLASGLFTEYQVASILDYRSRNGDIVSMAEFSCVDGFNQQYVDLLRPFISLESSLNPLSSASSTSAIHNELSLRGGYRYSSDNHQWQYGLKYGIDVGSGLKASLGLSKSISEKSPVPSAFTFSASYDFRKTDARLVLGDFNARFGQGMAAWSGDFMNSLTSPSGFMKKASGVTPLRSFTGSSANTGLASEFGFGRFVISSAVSFPGLKSVLLAPGSSKKISVQPLFNIRWCGRVGSIGLTTVAQLPIHSRPSPTGVVSSVDAALCIKGVNIFSEIAYDWISRSINLVAGVDYSPLEWLRLASLAGWTQSEQWQFALSGSLTPGRKHSITFSSEVLHYLIPKDKTDKRSTQVKSQIRWEWKILEHLNIRLRISDRFRTWGQQHRAELRAEFDVKIGMCSIDTRICLLKCRDLSLLGHLDASFKTSLISSHLRIGLFKVDNWDDRIYVYEYDAPGSFNVPAYYGRGVWAASVLSFNIKRFMRLYFRASYTTYPFMSVENKKPGRAELKLQSVFRF